MNYCDLVTNVEEENVVQKSAGASNYGLMDYGVRSKQCFVFVHDLILVKFPTLNTNK